MPDGIFQIQIPNLPSLLEALGNAPETVKPTLQNAINKAQTILADNTTRNNVPWKTGHLATTFLPTFGDLWAIWKPTASYAAFVEFGTGIYGPAGVGWTQTNTFGIEGFISHHKGQRAQPYMENIINASNSDIIDLFQQALQIIINDIADSAE